MPEPRLRRAVRAVVMRPDDSVALVRFSFPAGETWATPGGGIEDGENHEQALRRELAEEIGLRDFHFDPRQLWLRTHEFRTAKWDGQQETIYVVRCEQNFDIDPGLTMAELENEFVTALAWWSPAEIGVAAASTRFAPRRLPSLLDDLRRDGHPPVPIDVSI